MSKIKFRVFAINDVNPHGKMYYPTDEVEFGVGNRDKVGAFVLSQQGDLLLTDADTLNCKGFTWARVSNNGIEIMQYTGLKDKNGAEIYEGDIVQHYGTDHFTQQSHADINPEIDTCIIKKSRNIVVFKEGSFRVGDLPFDYIGLEDIDSIKDACGCVDDETCDINGNEINESILGIEVIGNIYQNPELTTTQ